MKVDGNHSIRMLVEKASTGNTECFKELYEHLIDRVYAFIRSRTAQNEEAQDLAQEVFIALWEALPSFTYQSRGQFYAYVFVITRRKLAGHYKAQSNAAILIDDTDVLPDEVQDTTLVRDEVTRLLTTLDDVAKDIVILHHWSRYTFKEIGTLMMMEESTVRVRHHRALHLLRETIHSYEHTT